MNTHEISPLAWERMVLAVEKVRERMQRAAAALEAAHVPYAVVGGNAVAAWVSEVDVAAVRNTPDVDILLRRADLERARQALTAAGFVHAARDGNHAFLDGPSASPRHAVHIIFAGEKVRPEHRLPAPDVNEARATATTRILALDSLVRMKLDTFRLKDRVHVRDLIDVGLVDATWRDRLPPELAERLQHLLDTPEG